MIYDGVWVGEGSRIPNVNGIRKSFIDTMRAVQAPVLRWPGGCFADSYDWRDGIGPRDKRPARTAFWGQQDTNTTVCTSSCAPAAPSAASPISQPICAHCPPATSTRRSNTATLPPAMCLRTQLRPQPEHPCRTARCERRHRALQRRPLGCRQRELGLRRQHGARRVCRRVPPLHRVDAELQQEPLRFVAVGPNGDDVDWTTRLFKALHANPEQRHLWGLSIHYYTSGSPRKFAAGDALQFNDESSTICSPAPASWIASSTITGRPSITSRAIAL